MFIFMITLEVAYYIELLSRSLALALTLALSLFFFPTTLPSFGRTESRKYDSAQD